MTARHMRFTHRSAGNARFSRKEHARACDRLPFVQTEFKSISVGCSRLLITQWLRQREKQKREAKLTVNVYGHNWPCKANTRPGWLRGKRRHRFLSKGEEESLPCRKESRLVGKSHNLPAILSRSMTRQLPPTATCNLSFSSPCVLPSLFLPWRLPLSPDLVTLSPSLNPPSRLAPFLPSVSLLLLPPSFNVFSVSRQQMNGADVRGYVLLIWSLCCLFFLLHMYDAL